MAVTNFSQQNKFTRGVRQSEIESALGLTPRSFYKRTSCESFNLIWEAGPYYQRVAEVLDQAHSYAIFVGWQIDSRIQLNIHRAEGFREMVVRLCRQKPDFHVYFLMWDYAYFYVFERELLQGWIWDNIHERVHFIFDNHHPYGGSHHEKLVIVDGETAFVGGVDICDDRWDMPEHRYDDERRSLRHDREEHWPYHDVIAELRGEAAADILEVVGSRWSALSSVRFPERPRLALAEGRGRYPLLISRTRARVGIERPLLVRETEFLFREIIRKAERELVIENQYYWSPKVNDEILALMRARAGTGFRLMLIVPSWHGGSFAYRMMGIEQTRLLDELTRVARETGTVLVMGCPFTRSRGQEKRIYVHSKVLIADDRYLVIGSSNFNNRGFRLDTELTITLLGDSPESRARIRDCARHVVEHWGPGATSAFFGLPTVLASAHPHVYLKDYHAAWDDYFRSFEGRLARHLPIQRIFDPPIPLGYVLKSRLAMGNTRRLRRALPLGGMGVLALGFGLSLWIAALFARFGVGELGGTFAFAMLLSLSWLLPVPTLLLSVGAGLQLGSDRAEALVFSALLVSAAIGYAFSRVFPSVARHFHQRFAPVWVSESLGLRRLPVVLHVVLNPRLTFQAKIGYQGVFSIPLRWFAPAMLLLAALNAAVARLAGFERRLVDNVFFLWAIVALATFIIIRRFRKL